jgi:hypothetical protein
VYRLQELRERELLRVQVQRQQRVRERLQRVQHRL